MLKHHQPPNSDLIVAIATPPGRGGIGIIRMSGPGLADVASALLDRPAVTGVVRRCNFLDSLSKPIDDGIVLRFDAPRSYTGEDILELQGHGGPAVQQLLLNRCLELGARLAEPGEFSLRAYLNGKLDLTQAEGIADLINATTATAARLAAANMRGALSTRITELATALMAVRCDLEAQIDFSDEDIDLDNDECLAIRLRSIAADLDELLAQCRRGAVLQEGVTVALVGAPNAGKSSLLNLLSGSDAAIVDSEPGTTRDIVTATCDIDGIAFRLQDTAGLRAGGRKVEREGMRRTQAAHTDADLTILVLDSTVIAAPVITADVTVRNKIDLSGEQPGTDGTTVRMSAKTGAGLEALKAILATKCGVDTGEEPRFLARQRHVRALEDAATALALALADGLALPEQTAEHLKVAHDAVGTITGVVSADDVLGEIFAKFCIGK